MKKAPQKILAGIGVVTLVGCAALGFLIFKKSGEFNAARDQFQGTANSYQALRSLPLYPSAENLKKLEAQRDAAAEGAEAALKELSPLAFPLEASTPEEFQEHLRQIVSSVVAKANERQVQLPADFYLGFERYKSQAPNAAAAPVLLRQLRAIELAINIMLDSRIDSIASLNRSELPEEGGKPAPAQLVSRFPFTVTFKGVQPAFRRVLNEISSNKQQFFIPRSVVVKTEGADKQLVKAGAASTSVDGASAASAEGVTAAPQGEGKAAALEYLVGNEKVDVTLGVEMVIFADSFTK